MKGTQLEPDATGSDPHDCRNLEEPQPERVHLNIGQGCIDEVFPQQVHEDVGSDMLEEAELIGGERMAGHPVTEYRVLQLFDVILTVTSTCVEVIDGFCWLLDVSDEEAGVLA